MPKWDEVASDPEFQSQAPEVRDRVRRNFFDTEIAPKVPATDLESVRSDFLRDTEPAAAPVAVAQEPPPDTAISPVEAAGGAFLDIPRRAFRGVRNLSQ